MRPRNINTVAHEWMEKEISPDSICVDATMGNGNDTLFLAERVKHVYAFDIQKEALENTVKKLEGRDNVTLILASHADMDQYIQTEIDLCIFNLGYLPKGGTSLTTLSSSTYTAIKKALALLKKDRCLFIVFYIGHPEGRKEYEDFLLYKDTLENISIENTYTYIDRKDAPLLYQIRKIL